MKLFKILAPAILFFQSLWIGKVFMSSNQLNNSSMTLKSTLATCTYSISLYDSYGDGWEGNTATVKVDGINVLDRITLGTGSGPARFNFNFSNMSSISVIYNPTGSYSYENSYNITSGPSGSGSNVFNSLPFFKNIENTCATTCTYSVRLYFNDYGPRGPNSLSVFVNGVASVVNLQLSTTENSKTANFIVISGDVIQIKFYFNYQGGNQNNLGYAYEVYSSANAAGTSVYTFIRTVPATPATIPNFCSKNLFLTISSPSITNPYLNSSIQLRVTPSFLPSNPMQILVTLVCGSSSTSQYQLSSSTVPFTIPSTYYGSCYFIASLDDPNVPPYANSSELSITLKYTASFTSPNNNSSFQFGDSIPVIILTTSPSTQILTVLLTCSNVALESFNVTTESQTMYTPPASAIGPCSFSVPNPPTLTQAPTPVTFTIEGVSIIEPNDGDKIAAGSSTIVELEYYPAFNSSSLPSTNVTLQCPGFIAETQVIVGQQGIFNIPIDFYGSSCNLTTSNPFYVSTNQKVLIITQPLTFTTPLNNTSIAAPENMNILLSSETITTSNTVLLEFSCESIAKQYFNVSTLVPFPYSYPNDSVGPCSLAVSSAPDFFALPSPLALNITQPVNFIKPLDSAEYFFNSDVIVFLSSNVNETSGFTGPTLYLQCSSLVTAYNNTPINANFNITLPTNYTGPCSLYTTSTEIYQASFTNITIDIYGIVETFEPKNETNIDANSNTPFIILSYPEQSLFPVILDCFIPETPSKTQMILSNSNNQTFNVPYNFYGNCTFFVNPPETNNKALKSADIDSYISNTVNVNITQNTLSVTSPYNTTVITYGQAVPLLVHMNGTTPVQYTASFACTTGSYQVSGLTTGITYNLVPAGIYGTVVITVTATNLNPGTRSFSIFKPGSNIPPFLIPGHLPHYPSVYVKMRDGKHFEIVEVKYSESAPLMN